MLLHMADLHINLSDTKDIEIVVNSLIQDLIKFQAQHNKKVNCICFTGDLIQRGDYGFKAENQFDLALKNFIYPLLLELELEFDMFFISPGNHEVDRTVIDSYLDFGLKSKLNNRNSINRFIDNLSPDHLERMHNFINFRDKNFTTHCIDKSLLFSTHKIDFSDFSIGIACLNSTWLSSGDNDFGNLIVGERQVDLAFDKIKNCSYKVSLMHHPTYWLKEEDKRYVDLSLNKFDLVLTGHLHDTKEQLNISSGNRTIFSSCGSLYQGRSDYNGYSIIDIDLEKQNITIYLREYQDKRRVFDKALSICENGQNTYPIRNNPITSVEKVDYVKKMKDEMTQKFNKTLITNITKSMAPKELKLLFVEPNLSRESEYRKEECETEQDLSWDKILESNNNIMFIGKKEVGKSTILYYFCLFYLERFSSKLKVPLIVDFNELPKGKDILLKHITKAIIEMTDFEIPFTKEAIKKMLKLGDCILLIDNFNLNNLKHLHALNEFIQNYPLNRYIITTNENIFHTINLHDFPSLYINYDQLYIRTFDRNKTRQLIRNWFSNREEIDIDILLDKITSNLYHINLPRTPLIISLFLAICEEQKDFVPINEAVLLERFIELILERISFKEAKLSTYDYLIKEDYLSYLAWEMVCNNRYCFSENEYYKLTIEYFEEQAFNLRESQFNSLFFEKGILIKHKERVYFRYQCFLEYFIAKKIQKDQAAYNFIVNNSHYTKFYNELIFLSGIQRNNQDLLNFLAHKIRKLALKIKNRINFEELNMFKLDSGAFDFDENIISELQDCKLSIEEKDKILDIDDTYIPEIQIINKDIKVEQEKSSSLINILVLYGRVLRNSELVNRDAKYKGLNLCIESFCMATALLLILVDKKLTYENLNKSIQPENKVEFIQESDIEIIRDILKVTVPLIFQNLIYETAGSRKLQQVILELMQRTSNDFLKFMYIFLYADLKLPNYMDYISKFVNQLNSKLLFQLAFFKLFYYYKFRDLSSKEESHILSIIGDVVLKIKKGNKFRKDLLIAKLKESNSGAKSFLLETK